MKHVYLLTFVALVFIVVSTPVRVLAQCTCSGGVPANAVTNNYTLSVTNLPSANIPFPKFDPSIGDLSCVTLDYNISSTSSTGVRNYAGPTSALDPSDPLYSPTGRLEYQFQLSISANVVGPGINIIKPFNKFYGPDSLGAYGQPDDTITYGPDNLFSGLIGSKNSTAVSSYLGASGTVNFGYSISGGLTTIEGGTNFNAKILTSYWGDFTLTYYWCPFQPLATNIINFSLLKKDDYISLEWLATNDQNNTSYEIQYSNNGVQFLGAGNQPANSATTGTVSEYRYQFHPNQAYVGQLYFRIKRTDASGRITYSSIKMIDLSAGSRSVGIQTYPNPVVNKITLTFDELQNANFVVDLVSTAGQIVQRKQASLSGNNVLNMDLTTHPAKGLYFLQARDLTHNIKYSTKVLVN